VAFNDCGNGGTYPVIEMNEPTTDSVRQQNLITKVPEHCNTIIKRRSESSRCNKTIIKTVTVVIKTIIRFLLGTRINVDIGVITVPSSTEPSPGRKPITILIRTFLTGAFVHITVAVIITKISANLISSWIDIFV